MSAKKTGAGYAAPKTKSIGKKSAAVTFAMARRVSMKGRGTLKAK